MHHAFAEPKSTWACTASRNGITSNCSAGATTCRRWPPILREQRILFSINHVFSSLTGRRTELDFEMFEDLFPAMETLNGHIPGGQ